MIVIGLMSGTSVDGIDAALVEINGRELDLQVKLLAGATFPYPRTLREQIIAVCEGSSLSMAELAALDDAIASSFALAALKIQSNNIQVELIGSHGQTVFHRPPQVEQRGAGGEDNRQILTPSNCPLAYSIQLARGELIANLTKVTTINNFRAGDIAAYGQGAPLVPKVDAYLLSHRDQVRCVQNIGGISNVTYLPRRRGDNWHQEVYGFDTGPGNVLLDLAVQQLTNGDQTFDKNGEMAKAGTIHKGLLEELLKEEFLQMPPPKSTGRELFGQEFLKKCRLHPLFVELSEADWLATLTAFTVKSIVNSYHRFLPQMPNQVLLCGGGSRNLYLQELLRTELPDVEVLTTDDVGLNAEFKEAIAFAVLAYWRLLSIPGNLPQVTGAKQEMLLGEIHFPIFM